MTHQINFQLVAQTLKQARLSAKLTQDELAKKSGMTKGAISQWESGKPIDYKVDKFLPVCKALGLDPYELLYGHANPKLSKPTLALREDNSDYDYPYKPIIDALTGLDVDAINALATAIKSIRA